MKSSTPKKPVSKSESETTESIKKDLSEEKDYRDLEDSLTDWDAEKNHSGRKK